MWHLGLLGRSCGVSKSVHLGPWVSWGSKVMKHLMAFILMMVLLLQIVHYRQQELGAEDEMNTFSTGRETKQSNKKLQKVLTISEENITSDNIKLKKMQDISENSLNKNYDSLELNHISNKYVNEYLLKNLNNSKYSVQNSEASNHLNNESSNVHQHVLSVDFLKSDINNEIGNLYVNKIEKCKHLGQRFPQLCPAKPPGLSGPIQILEEVQEVSSQVSSGVTLGGSWWPSYCVARYRVAIIVPYRDREKQVFPFLQHMHGLLQRQQLNYTIFFVQQKNGSELFNRAKLLNVGYTEARKAGPWDCYVFHDVDQLPENDHNLYHCSAMPRHLVVASSNKNYEPAYKTCVAGANSMTDLQMQAVNGWSNSYWGWGGEDDDMWRRITAAGMAVWRYPLNIGRYTMIQHKQQEKMELSKRQKLLKISHNNYKKDGLNTLQYTLLDTKLHALYTTFVVDIGSSSEE